MAAAIGAAVVYVGGWGAVASLAISAASLAYGYSAAKKAKDATSETAEKKQILRSSSSPLNYIYGKTRSAGLMIFAQEQSGDQEEGEWIHLVITHAGHEIDDTYSYKINDEPLENFSEYIQFASYENGRETADPFLLENCSSWTSEMKGQGFSWYRISLKFDQEKFPTGLPNINCIKRGYKIDDPRAGSIEWSDNPALCILHYLRNHLGWEDEYLILETFIDAANICDEEVATEDGSEKRYTIGCEIEDTDTPASVLERMLSSCGGEWIRVGGRIGLKVAAYYGPAFIDITEDDLIDGIEIQPEAELADSFNVVRGTFVDPNQNYSEVDFPEVRVQEWVDLDQEEIVMDLDLNYVQSPWQAQRLADIALKRARLGMTLKLPCNLRGFKAVPGTMINLSLDTIGFNKEEFIVIDWEFSIEGGVTLLVRRDLPEFYDDAIGRPITPPPLIDLPTGGIAAPSEPLFSAKAVGDVVQGVISWTNSSFKLAATNVIVKDTLGFVIQTASVPFPGSEMPLNGKLAGAYKVELQAVGVNTAVSTITKMDIVISPPVVPDFVAIKTSNWSVNLIPGYDLGSTPFGTLFEFYVSDTEQETPPDREPDEVASSWNQGGLTPDRFYYYWIRAVNSYGKSDWTKATAKTTRETGLVETLVEKLIGVEIYAGYIASEEVPEGQKPTFYLDAVDKMGTGIGTIKGGKLISSEVISDNYVIGMTGYRLTRNSAEFNSDVVFRGKLEAATGDFAGTVRADKIIGDLVSSKAYSVNTTQYHTPGWKTVASFIVKNNNTQVASCVIPSISYSAFARSSDPFSGSKATVYWSSRVLRNGSVIVADITKSDSDNAPSDGATAEIMSPTTISVSTADSMAVGAINTYTIQIYASWNANNGWVKASSNKIAPQLFRDGSAFS